MPHGGGLPLFHFSFFLCCVKSEDYLNIFKYCHSDLTIPLYGQISRWSTTEPILMLQLRQIVSKITKMSHSRERSTLGSEGTQKLAEKLSEDNTLEVGDGVTNSSGFLQIYKVSGVTRRFRFGF